MMPQITGMKNGCNILKHQNARTARVPTRMTTFVTVADNSFCRSVELNSSMVLSPVNGLSMAIIKFCAGAEPAGTAIMARGDVTWINSDLRASS
jgi:hypothetical protein